MRLLITSNRPGQARSIRAQPFVVFAPLAAMVNDSAAVMSVFAAPAWEELSDDGKAWVMALVRETLAAAVETVL